MDKESIKGHGVTKLMPLIRSAIWAKQYKQRHGVVSWLESHRLSRITDFIKKNEISNELAKDHSSALGEFYDWVTDNSEEFEVWMASKSPANAAKLACQNNVRLCPQAEKFVLEKASSRGSTFLEYCSHFGIVLKEMSNVTLKAAFGEKSSYEKRYIKRIEEKKKTLKSFLVQLINIEQVDPTKTVQELVESL
jgi:hypothetical protein